MRGRRLPWKAIPAAALAGSQLGHLLVYALRLGPGALAAQDSGVHAYFPSLATVLAGLSGGAFLGALVVVGAARILAARGSGRRQVGRPPYLDLVAVMFAAQLALFAVQETAEALLTGRPAASPTDLLLWGTMGQLPIAALAALGLRWLTAGFRRAVGELSGTRATAPLAPSLRLPPASPALQAPGLVVAWSPGRRLLRRGPPAAGR